MDKEEFTQLTEAQRAERLKELRERQKRWAEKYEANKPAIIQERLTPTAAKKLRILLREKSYRLMQAINLYVPLAIQLAFHMCQAMERLIIGGNRGAKTMCCAAEIAMAVLGKHPWIKYPQVGRVICVAKDGVKIGEVFFRKLFMPGAFEMTKDKTTGLWRAWNPEKDGWDCERRDALPLIPKREVAAIAWEDKKLNQPKKITLKNGWEFLFFTSAGKPMEGIDVDIVWFDEEIYEKGTLGSWYDEMAARLIDRSGRFIWSATPQGATPALWKLHEAAMESRSRPDPLVTEFHVTMDDNPFLPEKAKEEFREKAKRDPDEYRVRVLGEFLLTTHFVYPDFRRAKHTCDPFPIPHEWCRYMILDPGYTRPAAALFAVPPPDDKDHPHVYLYSELFGAQWDAKMFVKQLAVIMGGQNFQCFLSDAHHARKHQLNNKRIDQQYSEEMEKLRLRSVQSGYGFVLLGDPGHQGNYPLRDDCSRVRSWLWDREGFDTPKLQIFSNCTNVIDDMTKYRTKILKGKPTDVPDGTKYSEGPDLIRYAVIHGVPFVAPTPIQRAKSSVLNYFEKKWKEQRKSDQNYVVLGPTQKAS